MGMCSLMGVTELLHAVAYFWHLGGEEKFLQVLK